MQTTQQTTNSPVHIKVAHGNEFRRFLLTPKTYVQLETTLKTLFNLESGFRIKFQDDENDWVLLTTDEELSYATELSGSPLRLQIKPLETPVQTETQFPTCERGRGRGGRGKCGQGRGAGRGGCKSPEERLTFKSSRLTERINQLEAKLNSNKLPSERERVIRWRLSNLQEKLEFVKATQASLETNQPGAPTFPLDNPVPVPLDSESVTPTPTEEGERPWRGRGGCTRGPGCGGGRGGWRRAMEGGEERPIRGRKARIAPEIMANLRQCKADLFAAREAGESAEKVAALKEAFQTAKAAKWEAMAALKAQEAGVAEEQKA